MFHHNQLSASLVLDNNYFETAEISYGAFNCPQYYTLEKCKKKNPQKENKKQSNQVGILNKVSLLYFEMIFQCFYVVCVLYCIRHTGGRLQLCAIINK